MINNKLVANAIYSAVGGAPQVTEYNDNNNISKIEIYAGKDKPCEGVTTFATIGLSNYSIGLNAGDGREIRIEFISASDCSNEKFANVLSSCAFNIINSKFSCKLGTVFPNVVKEYYPEYTMQHIYFTTPFLWEKLHELNDESRLLTWLMAIPISDSEFKFLAQKGNAALEDLFSEKNIDVYDLNRQSVV